MGPTPHTPPVVPHLTVPASLHTSRLTCADPNPARARPHLPSHPRLFLIASESLSLPTLEPRHHRTASRTTRHEPHRKGPLCRVHCLLRRLNLGRAPHPDARTRGPSPPPALP